MKIRTLYLSLALSLLAYHLAVSADYISNFSSFPAYPYNTASYKQSGAFVGCGPTTGAMIFGYFQAVNSLTGLLTNPGTGVDKGLNTAWALHGASYMNTGTDGFGDVYKIKSGLENYAKSRGYTVKVVIHVSPTYTDPNNASWGAYGTYGNAWTNDGNFWKQNSGNTWSIDSDKFCDFCATELSQGIPIFLTIDTKAAGTGDHWVPLVGYDKSAKKYAYYDTYDTSVHWADVYYSGDPAGKKANSIVMVRSVAYSTGGGGGTGSGGKIVVTTTAAFGTGSLGDAIAYANTHAGMDTILFNIPKTASGFNATTGVWSIAPTTSFQGIEEAGVVIDGFSQKDFIGQDTNPDGPEIQLIGTGAGPNTDGLYITAPKAEISGLTVCGFRIGIVMMGVKSGRISGCYIGTNAKGDKATPNQDGIWLGHRTHNVVIEPVNWQPNLISGNTDAGICFSDTSFHNVVRGDIIGMDRTEKSAIPNSGSAGILSRNDCYENTITDNHISANRCGVYLTTTHRDTLVHNWIGTNPPWDPGLGNQNEGVFIDEASDGNLVQENIIGRNGGFGIRVVGQKSVHNRLVRNGVSWNTGGGIGNESGGNAELQAPLILSAASNAVTGTAAPNSSVEIFTDPSNQGAMFQGETTADASGHFSWNVSVGGPFNHVTAIAIDPSGNTSPFSQSAVTAVENTSNSGVPGAFSLSQNFPNPFNPSTAIGYTIPKAGPVRLTVCDLRGREVAVLKDGMETAGTHTIRFYASRLTSGIYIYKIETANHVQSKKLMLMK